LKGNIRNESVLKENMEGIWNFENLNIDGKKLLKWISKE
jgi:hypothetical protein